ncbi:hypothetical protein KSP39_PZI015925 [Platanthera zijinensis]|uniref:Uncharacterized protein n=1 Tax=Platanthera zijinensis TaxID=2320716 RepID=A0AAP0G1F5_9ASPA
MFVDEEGVLADDSSFPPRKSHPEHNFSSLTILISLLLSPPELYSSSSSLGVFALV